MWPQSKGEALDHTLAAEQAISDLVSAALSQWLDGPLHREVLPTLASQLAASGSSYNGDPNQPPPDKQFLPPNIAAFTSATSAGRWDQLSSDLILTGLAVIWALAFTQTRSSLHNGDDDGVVGVSPGDVAAVRPPADVLKVVARATSMTPDQIAQAVAETEHTTGAPTSRNDLLAQFQTYINDIPALVARSVQAAVNNLDQAAAADERQVRVTISQTMNPASVEMRDLARDQGYQAAGVQNHAVLAAARSGDDADDLEKVWIATIDSRTRDTHFAADGQRAPLRGKFTVGGVQLDRPGDPTGPAREVRNCRCRVGVLAAGETLPDEIDRHTERLAGRDATASRRTGSQQDEIDRRADKGVVRAREDDDGIGRTASGGTEMGNVTAAVGDQTADGGTIVAEGIITDDGTTVFTDTGDDTDAEMYRTFTDQPVAQIGVPTSDGRLIASDVDMTMREMPLPLMWMKQTGSGFGGHTEAFTVGVIESAKVDGAVVSASGYLLNTPEADEAAGELAHGVSGPSVDLAATEWKLTDADGKEISEEDWYDLPIDAEVYQTITAAELIGTTLVATPAFGSTKLALDAERQSRNVAVVASAAADFRPRVYPARFFADPQLTGPTLPTMDDDGRIFGHLACFGECHRSIQSQCVMAPRSKTGYSHFHTSPAVRLDDGSSIPVGRLTVGTGHADDRISGGAAMAHYDNTGTCFALVRVGEDAHGVWFSGVANPTATAEQVEAGISAPLSGDWRSFGAGLELVAALAVNTPGFAARGREDDRGRPVTLVASLGPSPLSKTALRGPSLTLADIRNAVKAALDERDRATETMELLNRARLTVGDPPTPNEEIAALLGGRK
jgi:hypothetical protein